MGKDGVKQFLAVTGKNFILQTRSRKSFLGLGGWGALLIQLLLPVAFFLVMYLPKHYIKPTRHGETMGWAPVQLESRSWAQPYDGPAVYPESGGRARLLLAPDTPRVRGLARALARTLACPRDPAKRTCPVPNLPPNFHCMFMPPPQPKPKPPQPAQAVAHAAVAAGAVGEGLVGGVLQQQEQRVEGVRARAWGAAGGTERFLGWGWGLPWSGGAQSTNGLERGTEEPRLGAADADPCADFDTCMSTPACYDHVLRDQIVFMASEEAARRNVTEEPEVYDALLVFPGEVSPRREGEPGEVLSRRSGGTGEDPLYWGHGGDEGNLEGAQEQQLAAVVGAEGAVAEGWQHDEGAAAASSPLRSLSRVVVSMNHTDVPPTQLILDQFEVVPTRGNGLALYKRYWFLTNLQLALGRTLMGLHVAMHTPPPPPPPPPSPSPPQEPPAASVTQHMPGTKSLAAGPSGSVPRSGQRGIYGTRGNSGGDTDIPDELYDSAVPVDVAVSYKAFPWPSVTEDLGAASAAVFFNLLLVYAFLAPTRAVVGDIVREKELRLREGMRILGLSEPAYWGSWALTHWLLLAASGALCAAAGAYPFSNSSTLVMLGFFWLYGAALVSYSYAMSTLFSSSRVAGTASQLLYALSMLPGFLMPATFEYGSWLWYASCLLPPSAASLFAAALVNWEKVAQGITPRTLWSPITAATPFSAGTVLSFLAFDVLFYAVLTWYLDKVMPKSYGQRLPWWFVFDARYWTRNVRRTNRRGRRGRSISQPPDGGGAAAGALTPLLPRGASADGRSANGGDTDTDDDRVGGLAGDAADGVARGAAGNRAAGAGAGAAVEVRGLCKEFPTPAGGGVKVAVDHLDLRIDRGRITALLGHNGAGKTTTIHILTGMLQPTSGTATVNGYDIAHQMDKVRSSLGVCPQFDILWPDLTVLEHLRLYADIKGYGRQEREQVAVRAAEEVGLGAKLHCAAGELSGGQRRKLSVAIAFLGDPAVVFLDEPTSGMDPYSRRFTWDIIRRHRSASAVVLTTHSMEEADLLGDRIIIMARGRVAAAGSSMELKSSVGVGYNLTLVMQQPNDPQNPPPPPGPHTPAANGTSPSPAPAPASPLTSAADTARSHVPAADASSAAAALALARCHVPGAELLSAAGAEVVLRLPREAAGAFPPLLRALAGAEGRAAGVASFGLSVTTLEEVFLSITAAAERDQPTDLTTQAAAAAPFSGASFPSPSSLPSPPKTPTPSPVPDQPPHLTASSTSPSPSSAPSPPSDTGPPAAVQPLRGWRLYGSQLRALLTKRALCARRDRLAVVTQLAVPLALVYLALWISALQVREPSQPPLELSRAACLLGRPLPASASARARNATWDPVSSFSTSPTEHTKRHSAESNLGNRNAEQQLLRDPQPLLPLFLSGYPPASGVHDSGAAALYTGDPKVPRSSTLEFFLLKRWFGGNKYGSPSYDAVHVDELPSPYDVASGRGRLSLVLLTNQSAVSALPAAVSELLTAALSYIDHGLQPPPSQQHPVAETATPAPLPGDASTTEAAEADATIPAFTRAYESGTGPFHRRLRGTTAILKTDTASSQSTESASYPSSSAQTAFASTSSPAPPPFPFSFVSRPLPTLPSEPVVQVQRDAASLMLALCMTLAASVLSASFVVFLVREQDNNSKHLQLVSGAPPTAYWAANYLWDLLAFSGSAAGIVGLVAAYRLPQFSGQRLAAVAGLLWGFGGAGLSMTYMLHFLFKDEMRALQRLNTLYFLTGYLGFVATWVMDLILLLARPAGLAAWNDGVKGVLRTASPHYCFARGVYDVQATYGTGFPFFPRGKPFDWDIFGSPMVHMAVQAFVYGAIAVLYDTGMTAAVHSWLQGAMGRLREALRAAWAGARRRSGGDAGGGARDVEAAPLSLRRALLAPEDGEREGEGPGGAVGGTVSAADRGAAAADLSRQQQQQEGHRAGHWNGAEADGDGDEDEDEEGGEDEDEDVAAERQAVQAGRRADSQVLLDGVRKSYSQGPFRPPVRAVRGLWVGVPRGECFGLLGVNGAGKTTTFRMLTGEVLPDAGDALVGGHSVRRALGAARRQLGYCPQFEALPGAMTGREVLAMYARLRGVPELHVQPLVAQLLRRVGLEGAAEALCGAYSGGMKRKLGVAVALAGDPRVVALDEPSTGMDPGARRALWTCLQTEVIQAGRTVILTSHSMEECEALASRLTIMTAGRLRCLGTVQHLKSRFGQGYVLEIKTLPRSTSALSLDALPQRGTAVPALGAGTAAGGPRRASGGGAGALVAASGAASAAGGATSRSYESVGGAEGGEGDAPRLLHWLQGVCPGASLLQRDDNRHTFSVPRSSGPGCAPLDLAGLFEEVERHRQHLGVVDYCLTQTTLEQVFIALAGQQHHHEHSHQ